MEFLLTFWPKFSDPVRLVTLSSVTRKKSPNVYKSCTKNDFSRKMIDFDTCTKLPKNVEDLGKLIVAKGLKSCPKTNKSPNMVTLTFSILYYTSSYILF